MEFNGNMEEVTWRGRRVNRLFYFVITRKFHIKINISILVHYKLTKTKIESFTKPMQCTEKDHLTDTALPSKSIPCSRAAQWREISPALSTLKRYLEMSQPSATLGNLFKKNKQQQQHTNI